MAAAAAAGLETGVSEGGREEERRGELESYFKAEISPLLQ